MSAGTLFAVIFTLPQCPSSIFGRRRRQTWRRYDDQRIQRDLLCGGTVMMRKTVGRAVVSEIHRIGEEGIRGIEHDIIWCLVTGCGLYLKKQLFPIKKQERLKHTHP